MLCNYVDTRSSCAEGSLGLLFEYALRRLTHQYDGCGAPRTVHHDGFHHVEIARTDFEAFRFERTVADEQTKRDTGLLFLVSSLEAAGQKQT